MKWWILMFGLMWPIAARSPEASQSQLAVLQRRGHQTRLPSEHALIRRARDDDPSRPTVTLTRSLRRAGAQFLSEMFRMFPQITVQLRRDIYHATEDVLRIGSFLAGLQVAGWCLAHFLTSEEQTVLGQIAGGLEHLFGRLPPAHITPSPSQCHRAHIASPASEYQANPIVRLWDQEGRSTDDPAVGKKPLQTKNGRFYTAESVAIWLGEYLQQQKQQRQTQSGRPEPTVPEKRSGKQDVEPMKHPHESKHGEAKATDD